MADVEAWQNFEDVADVDAMADVSSLASAPSNPNTPTPNSFKT